MPNIESHRLVVGTGTQAREIAIETRPGSAPGIFWLGGFRSDMAGSKALALDALGAETGRAVTRFDYSGHGISGGDFNEGTISRWLEESLAVFATTKGPQIIVGSSMGGWLALLLVKALAAKGEKRAHGLVLIAPAVDFTHDLMLPSFSAEEKAALENQGFFDQPSQYSDQPYRINQALIADGENHRLFGGVIEAGCPIIILQGGQDPDVPQAHAIKLVTHLLHDPVTLTLIPDGDHRLSRDEDLVRLRDAVLRLAEG
ncbi:alpha/beta hydrolase [Devosia epidermidihirudinis]|uniref:Palmitoyl-protein thioesterase ABHD10, mitochondrial n=1 Tax=Devosia epidermidihirudinis TaxID=1293439 RepID=A0A0F5QAQ3_9HYPH|nr:alpha/beta hydrolase [Devosia epidermidihirudinis]KKC37813.1 alpha/beta hydrolase [Devosia epidermidihirudinis]